MRRREFIALVSGAAATWSRFAGAQQNTPRVVILWHGGSEQEEAIYLRAVRQGLSDFGYAEGKNVILENRFPAEVPERFISLATDLAAQKVDVLVAINRAAALAAQRATATIPIVFVAVPDPVGSKLVTSLAHPGGNITGLSNFAHDLTGKRLEHLKDLVPTVSRVGLLVNPGDKASSQIYIGEARRAANKLDLRLDPIEVTARSELAQAFEKMHDQHVDGVVVAQDGLFYVSRNDIADLALAHRLPTAVYSRETLEAGALVSYGPDNNGIFRRSGYYIDKIIKGASPAELPVEEPTKFEFIINRKTAKALGIAVPQTMLFAADDFVE
jgi:putative ABC transport system substrate-binding protein